MRLDDLLDVLVLELLLLLEVRVERRDDGVEGLVLAERPVRRALDAARGALRAAEPQRLLDALVAEPVQAFLHGPRLVDHAHADGARQVRIVGALWDDDDDLGRPAARRRFLRLHRRLSRLTKPRDCRRAARRPRPGPCCIRRAAVSPPQCVFCVCVCWRPDLGGARQNRCGLEFRFRVRWVDVDRDGGFRERCRRLAGRGRG